MPFGRRSEPPRARHSRGSCVASAVTVDWVLRVEGTLGVSELTKVMPRRRCAFRQDGPFRVGRRSLPPTVRVRAPGLEPPSTQRQAK